MYKLGVVIWTFVIFATSTAETINNKDVKYFVYTELHQNDPLEYEFPYRLNITIDPLKPVKILCHGYKDNSSSFWIKPTKTAYMAKQLTNVISVDWSKHAFNMYSHAVARAQSIGNHIATMVMHISVEYGIPLSHFHLIGHSIGAHISGYAGKKILETTNIKVGRITGLDPAGPSFNGNPVDQRLGTDDANYVDAIHSDIFLLGFRKALAHADYWPNGGSGQPGCSKLSNCNHLWAPKYFAESIATSFPARQCASYEDFTDNKCQNNVLAIMGENSAATTRGNFYLTINKAPPYSIITIKYIY